MAGLLALSACLWGCGGSGGSNASVVASVNGVPISSSSLNHWVRVESVVSYKVYPTEPVPKGVLPDPPNYSACIEWLGSASGPLESRALSAAQRKQGCIKRLANLKLKVLEFLIRYQWYLGEVKDQGITISESEVVRNVKRLIQAEIPGKGKLKLYMAATGMSQADLLFIQRLTLYSEKIIKQALAKPNASEGRRVLAQFTSKWIAKTDCQPGYVVPGCQQYHGNASVL